MYKKVLEKEFKHEQALNFENLIEVETSDKKSKKLFNKKNNEEQEYKTVSTNHICNMYINSKWIIYSYSI